MISTRGKNAGVSRLMKYFPVSNTSLEVSPLSTGDHLFDLLGRDANGPIKRDARAGENRGEQVALIAFGFWQEASRVDRAAAFAGDNKGEVFARVFVAVFEA